MVERRRYGWELYRADWVPAVRHACSVNIRTVGASAQSVEVGLLHLRDGDVVAQSGKDGVSVEGGDGNC